MPFVGSVPVEEADGFLKQQYEEISHLLGAGIVPNLALAWSLQPELAQAWIDLGRLARHKVGLDDLRYEILLTRITYNLKCAYVTMNHAWILRKLGGYTTQEVVDLIRDWRDKGLSDKEIAMLTLADIVCEGSHKVQAVDIDRLRQAGFAESQITALVFLIGWLVTDAVIPNALGPELDEFSHEFRSIIVGD